MRGYLDGEIDEPPPERRRIRGGRDRLGGHVTFVGVEKEMGNGQHEIIGPVHAHPLKGKLFLGGQFLYAPVHQFVRAPLVGPFNDRTGLEISVAPCGPQSLVRFGAVADIGVDQVVRSGELHRELSFFVPLQPGEYAPAELRPALQPVAQLDVLPDGLALLHPVEGSPGELLDILLYVRVQFPRGNEVDPQLLLEHLIGPLVGEPAVGAQDDGDLGRVPFADKLHDRPCPVRIVGPMVGMCTALPEHDVHQVRAPADVQELEPLLALVGGLAALPLLRAIVVEHHGIDAQFHDLWPLDLQAPNEQFVEYPVEDNARNQ